MSHDVFHLISAPREEQSIILTYGGLASLALIVWIGYLLWRDRGKFNQRGKQIRTNLRRRKKRKR